MPRDAPRSRAARGARRSAAPGPARPRRRRSASRGRGAPPQVGPGTPRPPPETPDAVAQPSTAVAPAAPVSPRWGPAMPAPPAGRQPAPRRVATTPAGAAYLSTAAAAALYERLMPVHRSHARLAAVPRQAPSGGPCRPQGADRTREGVPVIDRVVPLSEVPDAGRSVGTRQARGKPVIQLARVTRPLRLPASPISPRSRP